MDEPGTAQRLQSLSKLPDQFSPLIKLVVPLIHHATGLERSSSLDPREAAAFPISPFGFDPATV